MRESFNVSVGGMTPGGIWFGIQLIYRRHVSGADRNVDVRLVGDEKDGRIPVTRESFPSVAAMTVEEARWTDARSWTVT